MKKMKSILYLFLFFIATSACVNDTSTNQFHVMKPNIDDSTIDKSDSIENALDHLDTLIKIVGTGDNKYIFLDTLKFRISDSINISPANIFAGIYKPKSGSLIRCQFLVTKKLAFVCTFEDLGFGRRGYLYAFDIANKSLVRDDEFKHNYLYSSEGIFIIDPESSKIFSVDKSGWYDAKEQGIVPASMFIVKGKQFKNEKNVYEFGNDVPDDKALLEFFNKSLQVKLGGGVFELPESWWKTNTK